MAVCAVIRALVLTIQRIGGQRLKVKIHVQYPSGEKVFTRKTSRDSEKETVLIRRKKGNIPEWRAEIAQGSLILHKSFWGSSQHCHIKPEAPKTIPMNRDLKSEEIPVWDKKTSQAFITAGILKRRGEETKEKTNMGLWVIAVLVILSIIIPFILDRMGR